MTDPITQQFSHNNYILHNKIGEGKFGRVYKGTQISTGQAVAIKVIKYTNGSYSNFENKQITKFKQEIHLCTKISHPNIIKVLDRGITNDNLQFAVFEYIFGITLKDYILTKKKMSISDIVELMSQVLDALVCIHNKGIIHKDLKPKNIMIQHSGAKKHIKILDFGISQFTNKTLYIHSNKNNYYNQMSGSPAYSSPEQLRGEPTTYKTDLYSWGLILLECLTGRPAIKGNSINEILQLQLSSNNIFIPPNIANHPLGVILKKVLHKDPNKRPNESQIIFNEFNSLDFTSIKHQIESNTSFNHEDADLTL